MNEAIIDDPVPAAPKADGAGLAGFMLRRLVPALRHGVLTVVLPNGRALRFRGTTPEPTGTLVLHRWQTLRRLLTDGDLGLADAYIHGDWSSPDLVALIELFARNQASLRCTEGGLPLSRLINRLRHLARPNTLAGSRRNIVQHYDLGNDFYAHWLDGGMSYSSGLFDTGDTSPGGTSLGETSLEAAQAAKQDAVLGLLDLRPDQSVLEIGFGWGGLMERMAAGGNHVTGLTLSPAQYGYAQRRLGCAGLAERTDLRLQDYRLVDGTYDRIVSIEMLEAVGAAWWSVYFDTLRTRLRAGGTIVLQTITIADERFAAYQRNVDFIQRHVFPGGMLPSPAVLRAEVERAGLVVRQVRTFGASYAQTLKLWQARFQAAWPAIARSGFPPRFHRMWTYYLAYCEAGFRAGAVDVGLWQLGHRP